MIILRGSSYCVSTSYAVFFYRLWPVTVSDDWIRILGLCFWCLDNIREL